MGVAYFIVLERKIADLDASMDGKCLARASDTLDAVASDLGVRPLSEFISADPKAVAAMLEEHGADVGDVELPPLQQFGALQGLASVRALISHVQSQPGSVSDADLVVRDLQDCERILSSAEIHGVGWHFEVDF